MDANDNAFSGVPTAPKKRVLFVITQSELGGAQQFLTQFLEHLRNGKFDIRVGVGHDGDDSLFDVLDSLGIAYSKLKSLRRNISPISDLRTIREIKKLIRSFQPDTLFLLSSKAGFIGSLAARLSAKPLRIVYRIGGWSFNDPWSLWKRKLWIFLERLSSKWKDVIILNNAHDLKQAQELSIKPREKIILIHNGIDPYKLELLPRDEARKTLLNEASFSGKIIGTIANFYPTKGLEYLIEAFSILNTRYLIHNTRLLIIGHGRERSALKNLIREYGLEDKVFLIGQRTHASRYLSAFDIFVLPSVKEGFPWSVLEAMSAKLPVIASRVGAVPEIIDDGLNGYVVEPRNPEQIVEKINFLLTNETMAKEMGIKAHQKVLFDFPGSKMLNRTESLL